jgi:hypothetical protein
MTDTPRSFARLWRVDCLHCGNPFDQWGKRGKLRRTCSEDCQIARNLYIRTERRRSRYRALVAAGAAPAVAQRGSWGDGNFKATLAALASMPDELLQRSDGRFKRVRVGRLRDIAKAPKAIRGFNRWRRSA